VKIRVLQTYPPLKMNLVPEIWTDWKRNLKTLPSTLLLLIRRIILASKSSMGICSSGTRRHFLVERHETRHACRTIVAETPIDKLLHLSSIKF
jgi:hypothetical protein